MGELVYDGFNKIEIIDCEVKGKMVKREKLHINDAVAGLVYDCEERMCLVEQFRPVPGKMSYEIPAGVMDKGKNPRDTLMEELSEECDLHIKDLVDFYSGDIAKYRMLSGSSDSVMTIYEICVVPQFDKNGKLLKEKPVDDVDVSSVHWCTLEEVEKLIHTGSIADGKTIIAYYHFKDMIMKLRRDAAGVY